MRWMVWREQFARHLAKMMKIEYVAGARSVAGLLFVEEIGPWRVSVAAHAFLGLTYS